MSRVQVMLLVAVYLSMTSTHLASISYGQGGAPCQVIRKYLLHVDEIATVTFGDERDKKLAQAQAEFRDQLGKLNYSLSTEMAELVRKFVSLSSFGHDRMRKGDARLLVKARELEVKIKGLCPWDQ